MRHSCQGDSASSEHERRELIEKDRPTILAIYTFSHIINKHVINELLTSVTFSCFQGSLCYSRLLQKEGDRGRESACVAVDNRSIFQIPSIHMNIQSEI